MHPKSTREYQAQYRLLNREKMLGYKRKYRERHPRPKKARTRLSAEEARVRARAQHDYKSKNTIRGKISHLRQRALTRAKAKGIPFNISARDIVVPACCPVFGTPFEVGPDVPLNHRMSLDRKKPELGYVKGNVEVISFRANSLKSNATIEELKAVLRHLELSELSG